MVKEISSIEEIPRNGKVVIDCFADWCGPCRGIAPKFAELSNMYNNITFLKINVDETEELSNQMGINALPTFVFIQNRNIVNRMEGANVSQLVTLLNIFAQSA